MKAQNAVNSLLDHWITKPRPPVFLVTDRGSDYINSELENLCTLMGIGHSPRTPYAPWSSGLVEKQIINLGTHLRLLLHNTPDISSTQVQMYAYALNLQPRSEKKFSPVPRNTAKNIIHLLGSKPSWFFMHFLFRFNGGTNCPAGTASCGAATANCGDAERLIESS